MRQVLVILVLISHFVCLSCQSESSIAAVTHSQLSVGLNECVFDDGQLYYVYVPRKSMESAEDSQILVVIHGYSGRLDTEEGRSKVKRGAERWQDLAEKQGWIIIAPHFEEKRFRNDYQRLNLFGLRADLRLLDLVDTVRTELSEISLDSAILLFGFSGGGQFVHRFCAFHADRVSRAVAGSAGWYMWPDPKLPYPIGVRSASLPKGVEPNLQALCGTDLLIIVGENDTNQGSFRANYRQYDLISLQGSGRRERAQKWYNAVQEIAREKNWNCSVRFQVVPNTEHTISSALEEASARFFVD
jgi:poly(3-hydroxybutyrate) depolymerase